MLATRRNASLALERGLHLVDLASGAAQSDCRLPLAMNARRRSSARARVNRLRIAARPAGFAGLDNHWLLLLLLISAATSCTAPSSSNPSRSGLDARPANPRCLAPERPKDNTGVALQRAFPALSFSQPIFLTFPPGEPQRLVVVQQGGLALSFPNQNGATAATPFVDVTAKVGNVAGSEKGFLGLAFHPQWATKREAFLSYTAPGGPTGLRSILSRVKSSDGGQTLDLATEQVVLEVAQPYENHNGGGIAFGPDGFLYYGLGDGGSGGDPENRAQNLDSLLGKFLRIDVDQSEGGKPYAIPPTNPFKTGGGRPEIFAWGLRNPWRWSFDRATGELWAGDVGQNTTEEVDRIVLGGNYGWRLMEGTRCYQPATCTGAGLVAPVVEYGRSEGNSITGGYVYRGTAIPGLVGKFLYADFGSGRLFAVGSNATGQPVPIPLLTAGFNVSAFGEAPDGELYLLDFGGGGLHKLIPSASSGAPATPFPATLSATGCFDATQPTRPAGGLIPFDLSSPLWSDGATKERFLALPDGARIGVATDGDFDFPVGSVLAKTFWLGGLRVETRLFMRHPDGSWGGYSYEWREDQSDADLLPAGKTRRVGEQSWGYPSRAECMACHTSAAGFALGPELAQLNRTRRYENGRTANQLETFDAIGLFARPLAPAPAEQPRLAEPLGLFDLERRARSYLHANCSGCHRPNGTTQAAMDLRATTPLAQMGVCSEVPRQGNLGLTDGRLLAPGAPERSVLLARMRSLSATRMPPLGTKVVDERGALLIESWIRSLTACP